MDGLINEAVSMTCQKCETEWALDEFESLTPYEQSQFKDGVGCPNCVHHVQIIVCQCGASSDSGTWFRMEVTIDQDVSGALIDSEAEQAALTILEQMGAEVTAVFAEGVVGECGG